MTRSLLYVALACLTALTVACQPATTAVVEGFCAAAIDAQVSLSAGPDVDFDTATEDEISTALGEFATRVGPLLDDLEANAPEEIQDEVSTVVTNARAAAETGDQAALESEEYQQAELAVGSYVVDNCQIQTHEVEGFDYGYNNVPTDAQSGRTAFRFANTGDELHEMVVFRIDDESLTIAQLLQMPQEEAMDNVTFTGVAFAEAGGEDVLFTDLEPGRYGIVCFIPIGTRSAEDLPEDESGATQPPHFTQGMVAEFTVGG